VESTASFDRGVRRDPLEEVSSVNATLVIGVGNVERGDDAAGRRVADILLRRGVRGTDVVGATGEGTALYWLWRGYRLVYLVDAAASGAPPGTIHRHDATMAPLPTRFRSSSSHAFGVAEAVELARSLGELPPRMTIYAIEGREFRLGAYPTEEVLRACEEVADRISAEVSEPPPSS